ncbi:MAG: cysteine--tRNA ligase, partial [Desulfobacterales bacterium]|nr:cysteine--tRNA ligase [Desulfobacterales bacterium]
MNYSILDTIGNTPLVEIKRLNPNPRVKILAKLEYFNPGGSIKDRSALFMIKAGEKSGELTMNKTVIEATSGNTGIGLALVCSVKGYKLLLTMSESASVERQKILKARSAEILLTPSHLGTDGAIEEAYRLARENPEIYFMTDQFNNAANWQAHYHGTAEEIWKQTTGKVTMVVATMGTTGTVMGISKRLKEYNPDICIVGVEPYLNHKIQGLKNMKEAYRPEIFDKNLLDKKVNIDDEEAFEMTRRLAKEEGIFAGMSSGAATVIARKEAKNMAEGTIVVIFPDGGERYLSTPLFDARDRAKLRVFNTMGKSKEPFEPILPGKASMYSCGPTAHARIHMGECRRFVFADLLCRYLEYRGYSVTHIMNITDMDDKTIHGSEKAGLSLSEFTGKHIESFMTDLKTLNIKPADKYPRASEHVEDMVALAEKLVNKGFAYEKLHSIYFDISRFSDYGRLSGIDVDKIRLGATVDLDEYEKDNPRDFTLLKRSKLSELKRGIYVKTDWGNVRPSWHLQCAAISMKYLGESFDIHTSGRELVFPHHENEIAIAGSVTGKPLAKYWMHCDRVLVDGKKMDENKTGGTLADLNNMGYSKRIIRYWLIASHYRKPVTLSTDRLNSAEHSLKRLDSCIQALLNIEEGAPYPELDDQLLYDIKHGFNDAMDDDLNISAAMASIFKIVKQINILVLKKMIDPIGASRIMDA